MPSISPPVLITGGAGFIGSTFVRQWLAAQSSPIVNLDKLTYAGLLASLGDTLDNRRHTLVAGDVADAPLVRELFSAHQPRAVVHLAAESHVDRSIAAPPQFIQTNVLGTCVLLDEATRYWRSLTADAQRSFRLLLVSTDEVFGSAGVDEVFDADSPLAPNSPYAASKAGAEHLARSFMHTYGLPVMIVNPTNNYGPRQLPEKLIPRMILAASRRQTLPLFGDGRQERDWLHVDDCCRGIIAVLERGEPGMRYPMGASNYRTNESVVGAICDLLDQRLGGGPSRRALIRHVQDRPGHDRRYAVDWSKLRSLGWAPRVDFQTGLAATVDWYLENISWVAEAEESLQRSGFSSVAE